MDRTTRKVEHIEHTLKLPRPSLSSFDDITFVHQSLPNVNVDHIDTSTTFGELTLSSPLFINAMTGGGGERTVKINRQLANIAKDYNIPIAVGSQMAALRDKKERKSFEIVRKVNPSGIVIANLGSEATVDQVIEAIEMINANAIQIHINVIQELVMPEGDRKFMGALERIGEIVNRVSVPVIVKEVGFGMSKETATQLSKQGVTMIDVGGYGGTNFAKIENLRRNEALSIFDNWGIPTPISICEVRSIPFSLSIAATGGIRNGLDIAKSISLGASATGIAGLMLSAVHDGGEEKLKEVIETLLFELKMVMTALGCKSINELTQCPLVVNGNTFHWLNERGVNTSAFAQRTRI